MNITLDLYRVDRPIWDSSSVKEHELIDLASKMNKLPFIGGDEDHQYGFFHCGVKGNVVFGLFIQKFPKVLVDVDGTTKDEHEQVTRDTGKYVFLFNPKTYELFLHARRSADLPAKKEILKRFTQAFNTANMDSKFIVKLFYQPREEVDKDRVMNIFYNEADAILELDLADFDRNLIVQRKKGRGGKLQTYFNPIEEYQPAMDEAAFRFSDNAESAQIKAKQGASFKKDPIARAMLESSQRPKKIVYTKNSEIHTEYVIFKNQEIISIDGDDIDLEKNIDDIIEKLTDLRTTHKVERTQTDVDIKQGGLFDDGRNGTH